MAALPAQTIPVLKHPILSSPTIPTPNALFSPRKEFIRDHRIISSFSLLTLSGPSAVRLYSFPTTVINTLRRIFNEQNIIISCRENTANRFFEFTLDRRPWANVKNIDSERLIVAIINGILQHGFSFLSTIEYGREQDDRVAVAFSRPVSVPASTSLLPLPNGSTATLPHPARTPFAISFPATAVLRVIDPPLATTPAILQAVRNAWPRGVASEKRIGDSYEFKLKGYKWFQENTFATDSLQQILTLLAALDQHSFTLLTSLTLGTRSRLKDLWIFTGPAEEPCSDSTPSSPTSSNLDDLKRSRRGSWSPSSRPSSDTQQHARATTDTSPLASSPLRKSVTPPAAKPTGAVLRKPFPKATLPLAFSSEASLNDSILGQSPAKSSSDHGPNLAGLGSGHRRAESLPHTPDVFYSTPRADVATPTYRNEFNPWNRPDLGSGSPGAIQPPAPTHFPAASLAREFPKSGYPPDEALLRRASGDSPYDAARPRSSSAGSNAVSPSLQARLRRASSPLSGIAMTPPTIVTPTSGIQQDFLAVPNGHATPQAAPRDDQVQIDYLTAKTGAPTLPERTPTPPLLNPGTFRDSAFSSSTGWRSTDVPVAWTGKEPELFDEKRKTAFSANGSPPEQVQPSPGTTPPASTPSQRVMHGPRERRPSAERASTGPLPPGAWAPTPKEEKWADDVAIPNSMFPPTIKEQPSQEGDEPIIDASMIPTSQTSPQRPPAQRQPTPDKREGEVRALSPEQHRAQGDGARRSEAALIGTLAPSPTPAQNGSAAKQPPTAAKAALAKAGAQSSPKAQRPPQTRKVSTISDGWVLVNIEGHKGTRPVLPPRSSSHGGQQKPAVTGAGLSTMHPAAKAIVMIDAVGVKQAEEQKKAQASNSGFRKFLTKSSSKGRKGATPAASAEGTPVDERMGLKEKWKQRGTPTASRSHNKRYSID